MRILVIGGAGFIGAHIVHSLVVRGHDVVVMHRGGTEADLPPGVQRVHSSLADLPENHCLETDAAIHTCAYTEEDAATTLRLFRGRTGKLVVLSSGDVYRAYGVLQRTETGELEPLPLTEDSRLRTNLYPYRNEIYKGGDRGLANYEKILVERIVMSAPDLPACILRLPAVYGPGDRHHRFRAWVKCMDEKHPEIMIGVGMAGWRWTHGYVENVADAIVVASEDSQSSGQIYNIGEATVPTTAERARILANVHGWTGRIAIVPEDRLPQHLRLTMNFEQDMVVSTDRFSRALGFSDATSTEEGLNRTIAWERSAASRDSPTPRP